MQKLTHHPTYIRPMVVHWPPSHGETVWTVFPMWASAVWKLHRHHKISVIPHNNFTEKLMINFKFYFTHKFRKNPKCETTFELGTLLSKPLLLFISMVIHTITYIL